MDIEPTIVERPETHYVGILGRIPISQFHDVADKFPALLGWTSEQGLEPASEPFFKYEVVELPDRVEVACCVPLAAAVPGSGEIFSATLPGGRYASITHIGHPNKVIDLAEQLVEWGNAREGLEWDVDRTGEVVRWGARLEIYKSEPDVDMSQWEVEVAIRLADQDA